jgi:uncharacterized protein
MYELINEAAQTIVVPHLEVADTYFKRLIGLQFKPRLPPGQGLLLVPAGSVHTMCVRFPLDLVFIDAHGGVLRVRENVLPWRVALAPRGTHAVLEMSGGENRIRVGDRLAIRFPGGNIPRRLRFLAR